MTAAALATLAAILPLRYGTSHERDILFDDVTFLKTAVVERANIDIGPVTRVISHGQITNIADAVRASCGYFLDGSRLDTMNFGVEGAWKSQVGDSLTPPVPFPTDPLTNVFGFVTMTSTVPSVIGREIAIDPVLRMFRDVREMRYKADFIPSDSEDAWMEYVSSTDGTITNDTGSGAIFVREKKAVLESVWDDVLKTNKYEMTGVSEYNVAATKGNLTFAVSNATRCLVIANFYVHHETEDSSNEYLDNVTTVQKTAIAMVPFLVTASNNVAHIPQSAYTIGESLLTAFGFPTTMRSPSVTALEEAVDVIFDGATVYLLDVRWPTTDLSGSGWNWEPDGN